MIKIGFIFFDDLHIIHHFVGSVAELYKDNEVTVEILTSEREENYLITLLNLFDIPRTIIRKLPTFTYRKIIERLTKRKRPSSKYIFEKNKKKLLQYDTLVFNDTNHEYLYNFKKDGKPKFVLLMHGAGDGEYMIGEKYKSIINKFDLITTPGEKISSFYREMGISDSKIRTCGYQKFDVVEKEKNRLDDFKENKTIVLYNPHFKKDLSSWYKFGNLILDFFYYNNNYNLIFAPHINLFNKKGFLDKGIIDNKYYQKDNIHIDLGSINSVNMKYSLSADIYLGDVSSQVYEFLKTPKPCIFINAHAIKWKRNKHYQHWKLGKVIDNLDNLNSLLINNKVWGMEFNQIQINARKSTFDLSKKETASLRTAKAIKELSDLS